MSWKGIEQLVPICRNNSLPVDVLYLNMCRLGLSPELPIKIVVSLAVLPHQLLYSPHQLLSTHNVEYEYGSHL